MTHSCTFYDVALISNVGSCIFAHDTTRESCIKFTVFCTRPFPANQNVKFQWEYSIILPVVYMYIRCIQFSLVYADSTYGM